MGTMAETQAEHAEQLVELFEMFDDWEDRYAFLIDLGRQLPPMDEADKIEPNRVQGCQSQVWVVAHKRVQPEGAVIEFVADSDSAIVKGLIAVLHRVYSGQPADKILTYDIQSLLKRLDLEEHLSMNRRNGLYSMIQRIQALATAQE
jgi:cysteine desulfuration protein SufE